MDKPLTSSAISLPPLPEPAPESPGIVETVGTILFYFFLQMLASGLFAWFAAWLYAAPGRMPGIDDIRSVMGRPNVTVSVIIGTLFAAAFGTLAVVRWRWRPWLALSPPPGIGMTGTRRMLLLAGVVVGLLTPIAGGALTRLLAGNHEVSQTVTEIAAGSSTGMRMLLVLAVISLGPFVEEVLFRGALLSALRTSLTPAWAVAISSLIFACVHLPDLHWQWYALPNLFLLGAMCAWLRIASGSLWPAIAAHAANNLLATLAWFAVTHPS
jgi:membrane protease YdiL (CAAX protease family)